MGNSSAILKFLLSVTMQLDSGAILVEYDIRQLYPTRESCEIAAPDWVKEKKNVIKIDCKQIDARLWE